ncbi:17644_t:CDS:10 [Funneliformis geosporum]|nr:17644_t:CDS:10 [Funneliformis geosporum]
MPTAVTHFKTNIYECLEALPKYTLDQLYKEPATCLAIFRLLPPLARQFVMSLLFTQPINNPVNLTKSDLRLWVKNEEAALAKFDEALEKLSKLSIMTIDQSGYIQMNCEFRERFRDCLTGGGDHQSFGVPCKKPASDRPDIAFLDRHAMKQWEEILHFMVGTESMSQPSAAVLKVVTRAKLMKEGKDRLMITNKGFQFLLQDVNTQVWAFLIQYLDIADELLQMNVVEVLNFFFMLGSLELGMDYSVKGLTDTQKQLLDDLANFGLAYRRKKGSSRYYPTRLATTLTSGNSAVVSSAVTSSASTTTGEDGATEQGFIIVETNYKLYAYTESKLQISVLRLFCELQTRFANMVYALITRDSVRKALKHGITANQIISYLSSHAHPQMKKRIPLLPPTVVDQIRLWEIERNRLEATEGYLYKEFRNQGDYEMVLKYATNHGFVIWSNERKRMFSVTEEGHEHVRTSLINGYDENFTKNIKKSELKTFSIETSRNLLVSDNKELVKKSCNIENVEEPVIKRIRTNKRADPKGSTFNNSTKQN